MQPDRGAPGRIVILGRPAEGLPLIPPLEAGGHQVLLREQDGGMWGGQDVADPDLIVLRLTADDARGAPDAVAALRARGHSAVVAVTDPAPAAWRVRLFEAGAADVLEMPVLDRELQLRVEGVLSSRASLRLAETQVHQLQQQVSRRTAELDDARVQIADRLARTAEYRDDPTGGHVRRVATLSAALGEALGLPPDDVEIIARAAPLHDVGKIAIPDGILLKPGRLTRREAGVMEAHTGIGAQLLSGTDIRLLNVAATIALTHHEHWDGCGYPEGIRGKDIPLVGRIVGLADVFDALTSDRPYKRAWTLEEAIVELEAQRGRHLDPDVVDAALCMIRADALPLPVREHVRPAPLWEV